MIILGKPPKLCLSSSWRCKSLKARGILTNQELQMVVCSIGSYEVFFATNNQPYIRHFLNAKPIYISDSFFNCYFKLKMFFKSASSPSPIARHFVRSKHLTLLIKFFAPKFLKRFSCLAFFVCSLWSLMASEPCLGWPLQMMWSHATFVTPCHFFINSNECLFWG